MAPRSGTVSPSRFFISWRERVRVRTTSPPIHAGYLHRELFQLRERRRGVSKARTLGAQDLSSRQIVDSKHHLAVGGNRRTQNLLQSHGRKGGIDHHRHAGQPGSVAFVICDGRFFGAVQGLGCRPDGDKDPVHDRAQPQGVGQLRGVGRTQIGVDRSG